MTSVTIFDIKRFAVHDGPGIRTTVFFKGCPLNCWWCHNPEGISSEIEKFTEEKEFDGIKLKKALTLGRWIGQDELMEELEKDKIFMEDSGGGVTFSGGEPLMQDESVFSLLRSCRERGIHTAVDTSGLVSERIFRNTTELSDLILYDLKSLDDKIHRDFTGVSNKKILNNLQVALRGKARVILRIPMVTGFNDRPADQDKLLAYLGGLTGLDQVDILPYHPFGTQKYKRFHKENRQNEFGTPSKDKVNLLKTKLMNAGFTVNIGG